MKSIFVCVACGSPRVLRDAYVGINNEADVILFDDTFCEDCDGETSVTDVEVEDGFDLETDFYLPFCGEA